MKALDFDTFGFIEFGFQAHPRIDPKNHEIFNIGFDQDKHHVYRMSKDFKLIAENTVTLRAMQSIHDFVIAG